MPDFVSPGTEPSSATTTQDKWAQARAEVELSRQSKESESRQEGGKTLYEVLQANKAAKQEAFEESIKLKNQFRSLDEDEIDFLDSVLESTRAKEAAVKEETTEQLDLFRRQQEEAEKAVLLEQGSQSPEIEAQQWRAGKRKRRREPEAFKGLKLRKSSSSAADLPVPLARPLSKPSGLESADEKADKAAAAETEADKVATNIVKAESTAEQDPPLDLAAKTTSTSLPGLGLGGYSSDED